MAIKLPSLTKPQQQLIVAAVIGLSGFGYSYLRYFWLPVSARIAETQKKITDVEIEITRAEAQAARLPRVEKELELLNQQAADAEKRLPKERDLPALLDSVSLMARQNHISLASIAPGGPANKQYFTEVPYNLSASGTYHDLGRFFAAIALQERIFNVRNVQYTGAGASAGKEPVLTVTFTLVAYQYKG